MDWDPTAPVAAKEWPGLDSWEVDEPDMAIAMMGCDSTPVASCVADAVVGVGQRRPPVNVRSWSDERSSDVQGCSTMDDYIILNSIDEGTHGRVCTPFFFFFWPILFLVGSRLLLVSLPACCVDHVVLMWPGI